MTVKDVARKLKVSKSTVYDWVESGRLPHYRFGKEGARGAIRIDPEELEGFVAGMRPQEAPPNPGDVLAAPAPKAGETWNST